MTTTTPVRTVEHTTPPRTTLLDWLRRPRAALNPPVWLRWTIGLGSAAALLALPLVNPSYINQTVTLVMIWTIVGLGLNLLVGFGGQVSLGHSAFFAMGAYSVVIAGQAGWPHPLTLVVAGAVPFVIGYLIGLPALRLKGLQLGLVTLAMAIATPSAIRALGDLTRGNRGIAIDADPPAWVALEHDQWVFYLALACAGLAYLVTRRLARGRLGRSFVAVRDAELVAETLGVDVWQTKTRLFAASAVYAGVAGGLYALLLEFIGPENFGLAMSISFVTLIVVGGLATVPGAVLGALFVQYVPTWTSALSASATGVTYGVVLMVFAFFVPYGLVGLLRGILAPAVDRLPGRRPGRA
ncbi:branched-chain amino acid ABC transporter permease [Microbacterium thalassium]|uniref:Branched-chain amino acid transport system permease protein n=1 Tax=Microbacterium thalassium TaxID=362649 RepID=A0A7X0FNR4_9MICO|nr:branched-chain amino acid ABC transporter permease [Microbacterium thalassium]MBB6390801.1 branched-chain amino acid transport system permease protein [Microbacterium thalassium]GLK25909.1 branched-chain amino acid ABC transporter permease [Microbacterium thalassium]